MASNYDARESKNSCDRRLTILKNKISGLNDHSPFKGFLNKKEQFHNSQEQILSEDNLAHNKKEGFMDKHFNKKANSYVKLFISQMKKNSSNSLSQTKVSSNRMIKQIEDLYGVSYKETGNSFKGIKSRKQVQLSIQILTVIAILMLHFLSTFQCLFEDYRASTSHTTQIKAIKYACLFLTVIKITSSFALMTTVLGKKLEYISQIAYNYVTNVDFYLDILVLVSAILLLSLPQSQYSGVFVYVVTIMNVVYIQRMEEAIDVYFINNNTKKQFFALFKLLLANFFIVHFMATLLVGLTIIETLPDWMDRYNITDDDWWIKYIYSLYWSASIVATVGFGDIVVNSYIQAAFLTVIILFGCLILSYNIAEVGNIINQLAKTPNQVRHQLSVLRRLAEVTKIDQDLHHSIGEYIVHSAKIKKSFQIQERQELIQMLPSQMKEEFIQQSSRNFCVSLPFFFMLQNQTQKLACSKLKLEVLSPNEYITHKRFGLTRIFILRKGIIGLAYKKKGSRLNGAILDTISIHQQKDNPELLNTYLLVRGKKLVYDIICQEYCVVGCLQFIDFICALKESQTDFQTYHQCRDEANFRINQWDKKTCVYCQVKHSLFVCPKLHYIPLRSLTFLKYQKGDAKNLQNRARSKYRREKAYLAKYSSVKLWKKLFVPVEYVLETNIQKSQLLRMAKLKSNDEDTRKLEESRRIQLENGYKIQFQRYFLRYYEKADVFQLDMPQDYKHYFNKHNPANFIEVQLKKDFHPIIIERLRSV